MKKQKKKKDKKNNLWTNRVLLLILMLAAFLRFYKLGDLFHWTLDEEFWSYIPFNIASGYHIPLIGGHISGTGLYSGPLFVWLMAIVFFLTQGNPLGIAVFVSMLGVVTTALTYFVGKTLFNNKVGLIASLLSASSMLMTIYDRKYWNANPIPLLSLLTILSIYQISKGKLKWSYLLALVLSIAFHAHMTSGALLLLVIVAWFVLKLPIKEKTVFYSIGLFFLMQLPLLLFELRHNFLNTRALLSFFSNAAKSTPLIPSFIQVGKLFSNTAGRLVFMPTNLDIAKELTLCQDYALFRSQPPIWAVAVALLSLIFIATKYKKTGFRLLGITVIVNFLGILWYRLLAGSIWYPGQLSEYFFLPSFPIIFLGLSALAVKLLEKTKVYRILVIIFIAILVLINVSALITATHSDSFTDKLQVVTQALRKVENSSFIFNIEGDDRCLIYGYRYLFSYLRNEPSASYLDPEFNWLYQDRLPQETPKKEVKIILRSGTITLNVKDVPEN